MADPFDRDATVSYGRAQDIAPRIRRVTCNNPGPMTFTGTQTYLVGETDLAVIDPGPADGAHLDALVQAVRPGQRITHILVTHTHRDHSPGARMLARITGASIHGFGPHGAGMSPTMQGLGDLGGGEGADTDFAPDETLREGAEVTGAGWRLRALHTPGHLSNHLSFELVGTGIVFTGDTVMAWATTLVSPPEGDMAAFIASLRRLGTRGDKLYLPGHGAPVRNPAAMVQHQLEHRTRRADQILAALVTGPATPAQLTRRIYTDTEPALWPAAQRNVLATLIGLMDQGYVEPIDGLDSDAEFRLL